MVLLRPEHDVWILANIWIYNDDTSTIYQLQDEVCSSPTMANDDIQIPEHIY